MNVVIMSFDKEGLDKVADEISTSLCGLCSYFIILFTSLPHTYVTLASSLLFKAVDGKAGDETNVT